MHRCAEPFEGGRSAAAAAGSQNEGKHAASQWAGPASWLGCVAVSSGSARRRRFVMPEDLLLRRQVCAVGASAWYPAWFAAAYLLRVNFVYCALAESSSIWLPGNPDSPALPHPLHLMPLS